MTFVYRLLVAYPPQSQEPGWEPPGWDRYESFGGNGRREYDDAEFRWPRERLYLSRSGARAMADVFRKYGAEVTIERSEPVTWTSAEEALGALKAKLLRTGVTP